MIELGVPAERDRLALEVGRPVRVLRILALGGAEVDIAAVNAVDHGAQVGALGLGECVMLGAADEGERLAGQHRVGVPAAGLDRDNLHVDVRLGEEAFGHRDIHRQVAGRMHRLGNQQLLRCGVPNDRR